jgi:hypothetical protein
MAALSPTTTVHGHNGMTLTAPNGGSSHGNGGHKRKADDALSQSNVEEGHNNSSDDSPASTTTTTSESKLEEKSSSSVSVASSSDVRANKAIHDGISCNECEMRPIIGNRYNCSICSSYNLCEACHSKNVHPLDHMFIKVSASQSNRLVNEEKGQVMFNKLLISKSHKHPLIIDILSTELSCKALVLTLSPSACICACI